VDARLADRILEVLQRRDPPAAFVTEVVATIHPTPRSDEMEKALRDLDRTGRVLVAEHAPPDIHLESTDLRVIARISSPSADDEARDSAEAFWGSWLRAFLANHRCE
jgi:hypothetical protein